MVVCPKSEQWSILSSRGGSSRPSLEAFPLIHDLVLATVFMSLIIAPALVAMRSDAGEQEAELSARELVLVAARQSRN